MKFTPINIHGAFLVELEPREDSRGSFSRAFCLREFEQQGIQFQVVQANLARTHQAGVVRGLHYQEKPAEEQKFVRCIAGAVYDVLVDMRPQSPSYRSVYAIRLDNHNRLALFIPGGVAHGYQVLEDNTEFMYMTDQYYTPGLEKGVRYSDPALGVQWPLPPRDVAERDERWPLLEPR
jgi:dTDP-4-dehydrorhamnose 3,5-epimerase